MRGQRGNYAGNYSIINSAAAVILAYFLPIFLCNLMTIGKYWSQ